MQEKITITVWIHKNMNLNKWTPNTTSSHIRSEQIMNMLIKSWEKVGGTDPRNEFRQVQITLEEIV